MQSGKDHEAQWQLMMRLIGEHQQVIKDFTLSPDKKGPTVKRGKRTKLIKLPLIVLRFDSSEPFTN
jgi:hypothetical protein